MAERKERENGDKIQAKQKAKGYWGQRERRRNRDMSSQDASR